MYLARTPEKRRAIVKVLTLKREPWKSLFLHEIDAYHEIEKTGYERNCPKLLGFDKKLFLSAWERVPGRVLGRGRFFFEKIRPRQTEQILGAIHWISKVRPQGAAGKGMEYSHGDLICGNILVSPNQVSLVDWEHAGMRPLRFGLDATLRLAERNRHARGR